jgi:ferredoxin
MAYRVRIDSEACIGSETCVTDAPQAFQLNEDGVAELQPGVSDLADQVLVRLARNCPSAAIVLYDEGGQEVEIFV